MYIVIIESCVKYWGCCGICIVLALERGEIRTIGREANPFLPKIHFARDESASFAVAVVLGGLINAGPAVWRASHVPARDMT